MNRRTFIKQCAAPTAVGLVTHPWQLIAQASLENGAADASSIVANPTPQFELSPYLYMQFMEPLGATDGSVEAAWDHLHEKWRDDVIEVTRELAPPMMRWGGIFSDYYRWREGVGPRTQRPSMLNLLWGGIESNQVGTAEFVDFCRQVGAKPLMCVNFESDGRQSYREANGRIRTADANEAAEWVAYCNQAGNAERRAHGYAEPLSIGHWQIGNETSYDKNGFNFDVAARKTVEFSQAMRKSDPGIKLIAWGDSGWARRMAEAAGDHVQYLAFHHMFDPDSPQHPVLRGELYRRDPDATWEQLMKAWQITDAKIRSVRDNLGRHPIPLALTECHFAIPGRDRCDALATWAAGVSYARILNNHQRHGDVLKIATAADFCGTRWQNNALMIPIPRGNGRAYLQPVARVMQLYRHHIGSHSLQIINTPNGLDAVASIRGESVFFHVANTRRTRPVRTRLAVQARKLLGGRVFEITSDPGVELSYLNSSEVMQTREKSCPPDNTWEFPPASVSVVEFKLAV